MATTIDLSLAGCVNGAPVNLTGQAELDGSTFEIDVMTRVVPLHWDPVLGVLGLLDAVYVLALVEAGHLEPLDVAFMSRKAQLRDEHTRDLGHELMSLVVRGTRVHAQYVSARTRLEPTERVTRVEPVTAPVALPAGRGSLLLTGAVGFNTDWGASYRVTSVTSVDTYAEGELAAPVQVTPTFGALLREEGERVRVSCGVELRALLPATSSTRTGQRRRGSWRQSGA